MKQEIDCKKKDVCGIEDSTDPDYCKSCSEYRKQRLKFERAMEKWKLRLMRG